MPHAWSRPPFSGVSKRWIVERTIAGSAASDALRKISSPTPELSQLSTASPAQYLVLGSQSAIEALAAVQMRSTPRYSHR
jgi:hypothetical protein